MYMYVFVNVRDNEVYVLPHCIGICNKLIVAMGMKGAQN